MKRTWMIAATWLVASVAVQQASAQTTRANDLATAIDSFLAPRIASDAFSGVVMFTPAHGKIYQRAVGIASRERREPMTVDTRIQIASTTKLFTEIAILQLEQAGLLRLSDTVGKFLPNYRNAVVRSKVTVDQLLHHRSGVGSFWNSNFMDRHASIRSVDDYLDLFEDDSLLFQPGTAETYSNGGYVILGAIIERVSGMPYHEYMRTHVFAPAGMNHTGPYDSRDIRPGDATGYTFQTMEGLSDGDRRLAGNGPRPGYGTAPAPQPGLVIRRPPDGTPNGQPVPPGGARMKLIGPDGKELSDSEVAAAMAQHSRDAKARVPNTAFEAGVSGPAGDDYSTAGDFLRLASALVRHRLLDKRHTDMLLGARYAAGGDFRANGGGPGVNAEFSMFPHGEVMVVLSNYDPPAATDVAQFIRTRIGSVAVNH